MRALIVTDSSSVEGGHRVQSMRTAEALGRLGVDAQVANGPHISFDGIDVVHIVGSDATSARRARLARKPVVLSPIYWERRYVLGLDGPVQTWQRALRVVRLLHSIRRRGADVTIARVAAPVLSTQLACECADMLLPNSISEATAIRAELGVSTPMHVVPNGVDHRLFTLPVSPTRRDGVLYVGRIEPHKNQLALIRALKPMGLPLTIAGSVHPDHARYFNQCREAAGSNVHFIQHVSQQELVSLYQQAAVHAMPSWFETTGLASLEASLCGAAVVSTCRGFVRDYFADDVEYCEPGNEESIRNAIVRAMDAGGSEPLRFRVLASYTWDNTAEATLAAYQVVCKST